MNGKKAKNIRKFLKSMGHSLSTRQYEGGQPPVFTRMAPNDKGEVAPSPNGTIIHKTRRGEPLRNTGESARAIYQEMKKRV